MDLIEDHNLIFQQAVSFVEHTQQSIFLTGKAGTGKTTFLRYIKSHSNKKMAVLAPTGVAAINAGGVTIHSFFQLPFGLFLPTNQTNWGEFTTQMSYNKEQLLSKLRLSKPKLDLIRELDLIIIDEVSMVRCDMVDAIDTVLRFVRHKQNLPFGGIQMVFIGDLYQLPPVVRNEEMQILNEYYESQFFFAAQVLKNAAPMYLELKKIYRQSSEKFIHLLNNIRNADVDKEDLELLNSLYQPDFSPEAEDNFITLTSHNAIADRINAQSLASLPGKLYEFEATVEGDFPEKSYPAEKKLCLKEGAQIMFIKNDKGEDRKYYNGKIGVIDSIGANKEIKIRFAEDNSLLTLTKEKWQNIKYQYDQQNDKIEEEEIGNFSQLPIRLAWAITIHKSQGLTFDKAVIDAGASFAAGQVYVALSRLRTMEGLVLRSKIYSSAISTDEAVLAYCSQEVDEGVLTEILSQAQKEYTFQLVKNAFDWAGLQRLLEEFIQEHSFKISIDKDDIVEKLIQAQKNIEQQLITAQKFIQQLDQLLKEGEKNGYGSLHDRTQAAVNWFTAAIDKDILTPVQLQIKSLKYLKKTSKLLKQLNNLILPFERKKKQMIMVANLTGTMKNSNDISSWLSSFRQEEENDSNINSTNIKLSGKPPKGETKKYSLELYKEGNAIEQIALLRQMAQSTIENHLTLFIMTGEVPVSLFVNPQQLEIISQLIAKNESASSAELKKILGEEYSYSQIHAVKRYLDYEKSKMDVK